MKPITPQAEIIEETQTLWASGRQPMGCPNCQRVFLVPTVSVHKLCPICRQGTLQSQPVRMRAAEPEKILPFQVRKSHLESIYDDFLDDVWFKPDDFNLQYLIQRTQPIFWPQWLVDTNISGNWQMEAGFDYQVESTKESYANGQWFSRKQIEDRVRWEPRLGEIDTRLENIHVPALEEHENRSLLTGTYRHQKTQNFDPQMLENAFLEVPDRPPSEAWQAALTQVKKEAAKSCAQAAGAGHQQNFALRANYQNQHWTQYLLPMYTTYYLDDEGHPQIIVVNGETGTIQGPRLASQKKGAQIALILGAVAVGLFILAVIGFVFMAIFPPAGLVAAFLSLLGFGVGCGALFPAIWPVQWNRKQTGPRIRMRKQPS